MPRHRLENGRLADERVREQARITRGARDDDGPLESRKRLVEPSAGCEGCAERDEHLAFDVLETVLPCDVQRALRKQRLLVDSA